MIAPVTHLVVTQVQSPPAKLSVGARFKARDTTLNKGRVTVGRSGTAYYFSTDRKLSPDDLSLGTRKVAKLGAGKAKSGSVRLKVPYIASGSYYLLACANTCRASKKKTKVATGPIPARGYFPRHSHSRTITTTLDTAHATSALVTSDGGGTLTATGADGTTYTLVMPPGALLSDETITMTPVSAIAGSPLGALAGAVQLGPDGLQLLKPATLTIVPGAAPKGPVAGFDAYAGGQDFNVYPLLPGNKGIVMSLNHFSTDGAEAATAAEIRTALDLMPSRTAAQLQELAGQVITDARLTKGPINDKKLALISAAYYRDVVKPKIDKAMTDDTYAEGAVYDLISWYRQMDVLGLSKYPYLSDLWNNVPNVIAAILRNAVKQRYARCVNGDDLSEVARLLGAERQAAILGIDLGDSSQLALKCAHFELDVDMTSTEKRQTGDDAYTANITVADTIPLSLAGPDAYKGDGSPDYSAWNIAIQFFCCATPDGTSVDAPSHAGFLLKYNVVETKDPKTGQVTRTVPEPEVDLRYDPGKTREFYQLTGSGRQNLTLWNDTWQDGHTGEAFPAQKGSYQILNWQTAAPGSGQHIVAEKIYPMRTYTFLGGTITETTTLKLIHKPQ